MRHQLRVMTSTTCSQSESEDLEEAGNELMLVDDEEVRRGSRATVLATGLAENDNDSFHKTP